MQLAKILLDLRQQQTHDEISRNVKFFCVFISNEGKKVPIWKQKAGDVANEGLVIWDYHVILCVRNLTNNVEEDEIIDYDTTLPYHCPLKSYLQQSFRPDMNIFSQYRQ